MNTQTHDERLALLRDIHGQFIDGLEFYKKFAATTNPKHKGIPYMAARDSFSSGMLYPYGRFWRLFKQTSEGMGLGQLWELAKERGGWTSHVRQAMGLLFPKGSLSVKVVKDVPTTVSGEPDKDPDRIQKALAHLEEAVQMMGSDLDQLELTLSSDPTLFNPSDDEIFEQVINRLRRL